MIKKLLILCIFSGILFVSTSCEKKHEPEPQVCIEAVVIADQTDLVGGLRVCGSVVQIVNQNMGVSWNGQNNCVFVQNLPTSLSAKNTQLYFRNYTQVASPVWLAGCLAPPSFTITVQNVSTQCL